MSSTTQPIGTSGTPITSPPTGHVPSYPVVLKGRHHPSSATSPPHDHTNIIPGGGITKSRVPPPVPPRGSPKVKRTNGPPSSTSSGSRDTGKGITNIPPCVTVPSMHHKNSYVDDDLESFDSEAEYTPVHDNLYSSKHANTQVYFRSHDAKVLPPSTDTISIEIPVRSECSENQSFYTRITNEAKKQLDKITTLRHSISFEGKDKEEGKTMNEVKKERIKMLENIKPMFTNTTKNLQRKFSKKQQDPTPPGVNFKIVATKKDFNETAPYEPKVKRLKNIFDRKSSKKEIKEQITKPAPKINEKYVQKSKQKFERERRISNRFEEQYLQKSIGPHGVQIYPKPIETVVQIRADVINDTSIDINDYV